MNSVTNDSLVESKISLKKAVYLSFIVVAGCVGFFFWGGKGVQNVLCSSQETMAICLVKLCCHHFPPALSHGSFTVHLKN